MNLPSGFIAGITIEAKGLLSCLCLLLAACFTIPAWGEERDMQVEEFVKKLEEAGDWPREKLEILLGMKLTDYDPGKAGMAGRFVYGKGLIVSQISHSRLPDTHETLSLRVLLAKESDCFTWDRFENLYPGTEVDIDMSSVLHHVYKTSWGELDLAFEPVPQPKTQRDKYCLMMISTETNKLLNFWKEFYKKNKK